MNAGSILVAGKLAERETQLARVGRLVVFDDEFNWSAKPRHPLCSLLQQRALRP